MEAGASGPGCSCMACPTYNECMRENEELSFCLMGKSRKCSFEKRGCLCITCHVSAHIHSPGSYYCIKPS